MNALKIIIAMVMLAGCAAVTQESIEQREDREYDQSIRSARISAEQKYCDEHRGKVEIQRRGGGSRMRSASNSMGRWDTWSCVTDE